MKRKALLLIFLVFAIGLTIFSPFSFPEAQAETLSGLPQGSTGSFGNIPKPVNWTDFWNLFNTHSAWDMEVREDSNWISKKADLQILRTYPNETLCKISLIFTSSQAGDYRLTFGIDLRVKNYTYKESKARYTLEYEEYSVFFDFSDLLAISNLIFSHGITEVDGLDVFWFRVRRDNVPQGAYLELDPTFGYSIAGGSSWTLEKRDEVFCKFLFDTASGNNGSGQSMTVRTWDSGYPAKMAVYDDDSGYPGNRLALTDYFYVGTYPSWEKADFVSTPTFVDGSYYWLGVWCDADLAESWFVAYTTGGTNQAVGPINDASPFDDPLQGGGAYQNIKISIYCTYTEVSSNTAPTIGEFSASDTTIYANEWFSVNATIQDTDGITEIKNGTMAMTGSVILAWDNTTGAFSINSDPSGYCSLNTSACIEEEKNSTAFTLSWNILLSWSYPQGSIDILAANTKAYDTNGASGSGSYSGLFTFEPDIRVMSATPSKTQADTGESLTISGSIYYQGKDQGPSNTTGLTAKLDQGGSLAGSTTSFSAGSFIISFNAPQNEGEYNYTVYTTSNPTSVQNQTFNITVTKVTGQGGYTSSGYRTPLQELGAPGVFAPSEVVAPEAQYGTIALLFIFGGATVMYISKRRNLQSLLISSKQKRREPRIKRKGSREPRIKRKASKEPRIKKR